MRTSLHEIGRFDNRLMFLYVDRAVIKHTSNAIAIHEFDGTTDVPVSSIATLMLGPGTSITHEAMKSLADNNCLVVWAGEFGIRFYAYGCGGSRHSRNLLRQAKLALYDPDRLRVVVKMYLHRFPEDSIDEKTTIQQLRGKEGARVRDAYAAAAKLYGVSWQGRNYDRSSWSRSDPVNRALSSANACLYGLVHAAIISAGYSPAIGFIHTGKQLSFVYDIADLYKAELTIPIAFQIASSQPDQLEREVRVECRQRFHAAKLLDRILPDIRKVLDIAADAGEDYQDDPARPSQLWDPPGVDPDTPIAQILAASITRDGTGDSTDGGTAA